MKYTYLALFEVDSENGGYTITFPDFSGAISEANTLNEAVYNAREVLEIFTIMFEDEKKEFPAPSSFKALAGELTSDADILQAISVDTDLVRERERSKTVNKTVTLPSWLVEAGKENKINFSQLLQKAIREELNV
ncbi:type II toxin-antitoxin system HicB family antitoxin [Streptococcus sciuri]|uniref:Type II toxin-antitoxin system HicB family antitoxin n=1 Tax=Streptococcus sciuri TaxID=2973939 RepID=A0ABT2F7F1_9STRE|nr:type II toxin-antitoxin system HicB family antitoxin [Streptococcus sciuri]MCS4488364.1 type II toxin-antitoxin system HicB family antitoxin [Streptococcus sciuri]